MKSFITLLVIGFAGYFAIKFALSHLIFKIKLLFTNKEKFLEKERMKYEDTIYAKDFYSKESDLMRRKYNVPGIYIFTNKVNHKVYVGQSVDLLRRINEHLSGRGNPDVHNDMEKGDKFIIRFIKLSETSFSNLDSLEKHYISKNNSFYAGYNKTKGNG